jgi:hypothetical protein
MQGRRLNPRLPFGLRAAVLAALLLSVWLATGPRGAAAGIEDQHLFVVSADAALSYYGPLGQSSLGGRVLGEPAATSDGRFVVVRGADNAVYYQEWAGGAWGGWRGLGGATLNPPSVARSGDELYVVAQGTNGSMYFRFQQAGQWVGGWNWGGGLMAEAPAVHAFNGRVHLLARSSMGRLLHGTLSAGVFSGWTDLFGILTTQPSVDANSTTLYVAFNGSNSAAWVRQLDTNGAWSAELPLSGVIQGAPAVAATETSVTVFARGADDTVYFQRQRPDGIWPRTWAWLSGRTTASPQAAASGEAAAVYVVGADASNTIWETAAFPSAWPGWSPLLAGAAAFTVQPAELGQRRAD